MPDTTPARVAFLGLGVMGFPMAGHLAKAGHAVTVYNRTTAKAEAWIARHGGRMATTPDAAAEGADVVFLCVGNDDDVRQVGGAALATLKPGGVVVDHTTASAAVAREMAAAAEAGGRHFIDAPVSGGQAGAENGLLTVMCGGGEEPFGRVKDVIAAYARSVVLLGASGAGQLAKMVNQICVVGVIQGLAEGLAFAQRAEIDGHTVVDVLSKGAGQSWQMENRGHTMLDGRFDFGFAVDLMRKDLGICLAEARANGAQLPLTELVNGFYAELQARGSGRLDTSSLITRLSP